MRLDDVELLVASGRATAYQVEKALSEIFEALQTSGATRYLVGIDVCNTQIASSVIGLFSLYESRLQSAFGWEKPLEKAQQVYSTIGSHRDTEQFENFRLAVNVLKHGKGASHVKLLSRADRLPFEVHTTFGSHLEEGNVCPPADLIVVTVEFLRLCCNAIEGSWKAIETVGLVP